MSRISERFEDLRARREMGLVAYITAGDPDLNATGEFVHALEQAGTDVLELGIPFSDPLADGPVIQRATERALASATTLEKVLRLVSDVRPRCAMPLMLFSYLNPILRYGFTRFAADARSAGVDGILITDLSVEEADEPTPGLTGPVPQGGTGPEARGGYLVEMRCAGLDTVFLAAPTSTDARLRKICDVSRGFVYVVSRTGVTGTRDSLSGQVAPLLRRVRELTPLPIAAGFGISTPEHVAALAGHADAAVVGSALVRVIEQTRSAEELAKLARALKTGVRC